MKERLENIIRRKKPGRAKRALYGNSRSAAIAEFCDTCMGGSTSEVKKCQDQVCQFWTFRGVADVRSPNSVPSLLELDALLAEKNKGRDYSNLVAADSDKLGDLL